MYGIPTLEEWARHLMGDAVFAEVYGRPFYTDGGLTPPIGAWTPGAKLLAAICRMEDAAFNMAVIRPGLRRAINQVRNDGRQVFDCRPGPGGVYHPERITA